MIRIAIIGAGISGAVLYQNLQQYNFNLTVFEKSRGCGGRCSTRYIKERKIDHGTSSFSLQDKEFEKFCNMFIQKGILKFEQGEYYATEGINKMSSCLIDEEDLIVNTQIKSIQRENNQWTLQDEEKNIYPNFDIVLCTIPAPQVLQLEIEPFSKKQKNELSKISYDSIATLIAYGANIEQEDILRLRKNPFFKKISVQRDGIVFHIQSEIANEIDTKEDIKDMVIDEIETTIGINIQKNFTLIPHLWRYAFARNHLEQLCWYDTKNNLGLCGDYFKIANLEGAFLSSKALVKKI